MRSYPIRKRIWSIFKAQCFTLVVVPKLFFSLVRKLKRIYVPVKSRGIVRFNGFFFLVYFETLIWSSVYNLVLILLVFSFSSSEDFKSLDETRRTIRLETRRCLSEILNEVPPPPLPPPISQVS